MNTVIKTIRAPVARPCLRKFSNNNNNIWGIPAIDLLHTDFDKIQQLKNDQFHLPFVMNEIPPPFCPKCNKSAKNKCSFSPIHDISIQEFDLEKNQDLVISCPIFGEVSTIFDNDAFVETALKKGD